MSPIKRLLLLCGLILLTAALSEAQIQMNRSVFGTGAVLSGSNSQGMIGTAGQHLVGVTVNNESVHGAGFWSTGLVGVGTGVERVPDGEIPRQFKLDQNYPNPFNPTTTIGFQLPESGQVRLTVFNVIGEIVARLIDGEMAAGSYQTTWDALDQTGRPVASGMYIYRLDTTMGTQVRLMTLMK